MTTLVIGASGATGTHLVEQLVELGQNVKVVVRPTAKITNSWKDHPNITVIEGQISEISLEEMKKCVADCDAVASCLGHNLSFKGIFGKPKKLVTDAVKLLSESIVENRPSEPVKFILMNTSGNRNRNLNERLSIGEKILLGMIRLSVPPQSDNEKAADYLRVAVGQENKYIDWVTVRPDSLINEEEVTDYEIHTSPVRSPLFNPGKTSRINVGNFMARLIVEKDLFDTWKGQMPVIYNKTFEK